MISTPPTLAGLFFCLASTRCRAFILPCCNTATYKRLQRVLPCQFNYTAHAIKHHTELCRGFSCNCTHSTARDTRPTHAAIIPPVPRWSVSQRRNASSIYHRYQRHAGRCTGQHSRPIIIRYIRVQGCATVTDPRQTVQHIADQASPAEQSSSKSAAERRGTIGGLRRSSFRASAR